MIAHAIEEVVSRAGNELTRENIMKQAATLKDLELPMLESGVLVNTSLTDYATLQDAYMQKFDGTNWQVMGELLHGD
jgi:branched-chain amino acid transport system substrate-binding protein